MQPWTKTVIRKGDSVIMLRISQLKLPVEHTPDQIRSKLIKTLKIREEELLGYQVRRQSLDARKKPELFYVYMVDFRVKNEKVGLSQTLCCTFQ